MKNTQSKRRLYQELSQQLALIVNLLLIVNPTRVLLN